MPLNENDRTEFKESFDHEDFEAGVVSFLNEEGGTIYFGVTNKGVGKGLEDIDKTMLSISESLLDRISPDCSELTFASGRSQSDSSRRQERLSSFPY